MSTAKTQTALSCFALVVLQLQIASTQDADCDYSSYVEPNKQYYVYSPNYPDAYGQGRTCRWIATCPDGYNCQLRCTVEMPQSQNCQMDRLLVAQSGDPGLADAHTYCGRGNFTQTSTGTRISVGLLTSQYSTGGRFICELNAVTATPSPSCSCGYKFTNRIMGGQETGVNEFPMMAGLLDTRIQQIKSGGTIISDIHVLTASHSLMGHTTQTLKVVVGEHNVDTNDSPRQELYVSNIQMHPYFNSNNYDNDIGIVTTASRIVFSQRVGPACLPFKYYQASFAGSRVEALGWGTLFPGGPTSPALQKVALDVISNQNCASRVESVTDRQMCTYTRGKDSCQDDSGGPLLFTESETGLLYSVGVISYGRFCGSEYPAINTRVTAQLDWILHATNNYPFCRK